MGLGLLNSLDAFENMEILNLQATSDQQNTENFREGILADGSYGGV